MLVYNKLFKCWFTKDCCFIATVNLPKSFPAQLSGMGISLQSSFRWMFADEWISLEVVDIEMSVGIPQKPVLVS